MVVVTNRDTENYRFLRLYSIDLDMARQTCDLLARQNSAELRHCILRDLVVTYARPFSANRGRVFRRHRLENDVIPVGMLALHTELLSLRDQAFAHTDHDFRKPRIARWPGKSGRASYPMSFSNPAYDSLLTQLASIGELIIAVETKVNETIRVFESTLDQLYPDEPQDSSEPDPGAPDA